MLHTNVGLANGAIGAINAACEHIPMLLMSGRTPVTEEGRFGARTVPIGWGQEMRDQAALVREASKWECELKFPEQVSALLDRAYAIATTTPKGPVYLSLPREVLCEEVDATGLDVPPSIRPGRIAPDPQAIATLAGWLAEAEAPLVIAQRGAGDGESFAAFSAWAEDWGIAVCSWWATHLAIPTDHPCHVGADPGPWLDQADVVVVVDCLAPWMPDAHRPRPEAKVVNIGPDPIFSRFPVRNFRSDLSIMGETAQTVPALIAAMNKLPRQEDRLTARRRALAATSEQIRASLFEASASERPDHQGVCEPGPRRKTQGPEKHGLLRTRHPAWNAFAPRPSVLVPGAAFGRSRLVLPRRARRPARGARQALCRDHGGRQLHVLEPCCLSPDRRSPASSCAGCHPEQRFLGRRPRLREGALSRWSRSKSQPSAADEPRSLAGLPEAGRGKPGLGAECGGSRAVRQRRRRSSRHGPQRAKMRIARRPNRLSDLAVSPHQNARDTRDRASERP
jgi:hypothetical protein